jgi:uncharacterized membrane protein
MPHADASIRRGNRRSRNGATLGSPVTEAEDTAAKGVPTVAVRTRRPWWRSVADDVDGARRFAILLLAGLAIVVAAPRISDVHNTRYYEIHRILPFEYPVLGRVLFVLERAVAGSPDAMARTHAVVAVLVAVVVAIALRRAGASSAVWTAAPTLLLVAQNVDAVTCLLVVLAVAEWRRQRAAASGAWIGLGAAYKIVPALLLLPLAAGSDRRRAVRMAVAAAATWALVNVPYALTDVERWRFPYRFAKLRDDVVGTVWAALRVGHATVNTLSAAAIAAVVVAASLLVLRRRLEPVRACALVLLAFLAVNKVWQPHYVLLAIALLAFVPPQPRSLRVLEVANLSYFAAYWALDSPSDSPPRIWLTSVARFAALVVVVWEVAAAGTVPPERGAAQPQREPGDRHARQRQPLDDVGLVDQDPDGEHVADRPHHRGPPPPPRAGE